MRSCGVARGFPAGRARSAPAALLLLAALTGGCDSSYVEVDHPFYLRHHELPHRFALFRCPNGPGEGCAIDGVPGPEIVAAGADERHVVVERRATRAGRGPSEYLYFARVPEETGGWGRNPERIVGPLDADEFAEAKARLRLPELTVRP